jgi:hypothetical protein
MCGPCLPSSQVYRAVRRIEKPWIGVPLVDGRRKPSIGMRQAFDRIDGLCAGDRAGRFYLVALSCCLTAHPPREVPGPQRFLESPMRALPDEPLIPRGDEPKITSMTFRELEGERLVGKGWRSLSAD